MTPDECRCRVSEAYPDENTRMEVIPHDMGTLWVMQHHWRIQDFDEAVPGVSSMVVMVNGRKCIVFAAVPTGTTGQTLKGEVEKLMGRSVTDVVPS